MANDITGNPLILDTAASTVLTTHNIEPTLIRWVGGTTAAHTCVVTNAAGIVIWASVANAASFIDQTIFPPEFNFSGLVMLTLASGKLYIYHAGPVPV